LKVTFKNQETRQEIVRKARLLRNMPPYRNIFVNPDLTLKQRQERKELNEELKRRRVLGEEVMIWKGKVIEKSNFPNFH